MIFLSYSWVDSAIAHSLHSSLELLGMDTWIDFERLDLEMDIGSQIEAAIVRSRVLLFLDTPSSRLSGWTRFELTIAEKAKVQVWRVNDHGTGRDIILPVAKAVMLDNDSRPTMRSGRVLSRRSRGPVAGPVPAPGVAKDILSVVAAEHLTSSDPCCGAFSGRRQELSAIEFHFRRS
jgi:hypothetical protein